MWGAEVEFLTAIQEDTGVTPPALLSRPSLTDGEGYYLRIFNELSASRNIAEMAGPIPISECLCYCIFWGIDTLGERETLFKYVTIMDRVYLKYQVEQREKRQKQKSPEK